MIYLTAVAAVFAIWLVLHLADQATYWRGRCLAAEAAPGPRVSTRRGCPEPAWTPPATDRIALGVITAPSNRDLWAWIDATNNDPVVTLGRPRLAGDPDTVTPSTLRAAA